MTNPTENNLLLAHDVLFPTQRHYALGDKLHQGRSNSDLRHIARYLDERDAADAQREAERSGCFAGHVDCDGEPLTTIPTHEYKRLMTDCEKFRDQVRDTCARAEKAEAEHEAFRGEVERVVSEALTFAASEDIGPLLRSLIRAKSEPDPKEEAVKQMAQRFLAWKLPENFHPDAGISYQRPNYAPQIDATPHGTNLLNAEQAEAMVRHLIDGLELVRKGDAA